MAIPICLNETSANEHIPEIEQNNRFLQERTVPKIVLKDIIYDIIIWMNTFHCKAGVSNKNTRSSIFGTTIDVYIDFCVPSVSEYYMHNKPNSTNKNNPCTTGAIALQAHGETQDCYIFLPLAHGRLSNVVRVQNYPRLTM